jgi:hypothetical protein
MISKKCWIYKRATLRKPDGTFRILDYSNGIRVQNLDTVEDKDGTNIFLWNIQTARDSRTLPIPLNIDKSKVDSIVRKGTFIVDNKGMIYEPSQRTKTATDGVIEWEFIFGKCESIWEYYLPTIIAIIVFIFVFLLIWWMRTSED